MAFKRLAIRQLRNIIVLLLVTTFGLAFSQHESLPWLDPLAERTTLEIDHPYYEAGRLMKREGVAVAQLLAPDAQEKHIHTLGSVVVDMAERGGELIQELDSQRVPRESIVRISSRYGYRIHPVLKKRRLHNGVDFAAPRGTTVRAVADGVITHAGWAGAAGKLVKIKHGEFESGYAHLATIDKNIRVGTRVEAGQTLGGVGSTGRSTGNHLHFTIRKDGRFIDPMKDNLDRIEPLVEVEIIAGVERNIGKMFTALNHSAFEMLALDEVSFEETEFADGFDDNFL